jgi:predicted RND superfamily exporter protein
VDRSDASRQSDSRADEVLQQKFHGTLSLYVVVDGTTPDSIKDPAMMEKLRCLQADVEQDPNIGGSLSIAEFVARLHRVIHEDRADMERIPASRELIAQYLLLYSLPGDPTAFADLVDDTYQQANIVIFLRSDHIWDYAGVKKRNKRLVL